MVVGQVGHDVEVFPGIEVGGQVQVPISIEVGSKIPQLLEGVGHVGPGSIQGLQFPANVLPRSVWRAGCIAMLVQL